MTTCTIDRTKTAQLLQPAGSNDGNLTTKRSREDLDQVDDQDHALTLDDVMSRMQLLFEETNRKIDLCRGDLHKEITTLRGDVQQFKKDCREELDQLTASVSTIRSDVCFNNERLAISEKSNDLLLTGVPYKPSENLASFIDAVSLALGYVEQEIPLIHSRRLARVPIGTGSTPPILVQFAFKAARDDFFRRYLSSRKLSLVHLGFSVNQRIYINESLTETGRRIKQQAMKLKRSGKLHAVFTKNGCVFVKSTVDAEAVPVYTLDQLIK